MIMSAEVGEGVHSDRWILRCLESMPRRRKYRRWSAEEKCSICGETRAPGVSVAQVAQVARRHALNANLIVSVV